MSKKVKVELLKPVTYKGEDFAVGIHEFEETAANNIVRKKLGKFVGESVEKVAEAEEEFTPLWFDETMKRFTSGDASDIVFKSLRFHQPAIVESRQKALENGSSPIGSGAEEDAQKNDRENAQTGENSEKTSVNAPESLPADFPQRHVFVRLGFNSVAEIQSKTKEELIALDGIAEASAEKALAYGKNQ